MILPSLDVNLIAFPTRLIKICFILRLSEYIIRSLDSLVGESNRIDLKFALMDINLMTS